MISTTTLHFLKELKENNSKEWMDANRASYESAKQNVIELIASVIASHGKSDHTIANQIAKSCLFRINRDIRFSKNKEPYKVNFGASITAGGRKAPLAGYYIHIEPGASFVGGGLYMPDPKILKNIRQEIDYNFEAIQQILKSSSFVKTYGQLDASPEFLLSRVPKGYEQDHPAASLLKLKSYIALKPLTDQQLQSDKLSSMITDAMAALQPLIAFLNQGMDV